MLDKRGFPTWQKVSPRSLQKGRVELRVPSVFPPPPGPPEAQAQQPLVLEVVPSQHLALISLRAAFFPLC